jgi:glycosyltransferase involved in cell wall biosynthesis
MTWENFYTPGTEQLGATVVRRFPVDQSREVESFNRLSSELHSKQKEASLAEQEDWMQAQGPVSTALLDYLRAEKDRYDIFIFFGYLYATSYFGLPLVRDKAWLQPLAHDEWTIYFSMWEAFFSRPKGFILNTAAERDFLRGRFPGASFSGPVAGVGIEPPHQIDAEQFRSRYNLTVPYLLYVGRVDESKGCAAMFENFLRWKQELATPHKLLLLGKEVMPIPFHDDIVYLGFVDDEQKWAALKGCDWLLVPSPHESLSMALLEAWAVGRPALVNSHCDVLVKHCHESHGGLWYSDFEEWSAALSTVDEKTRAILGRQGKAYVEERYAWARVEACYLEAVTGPKG